MADRRTRPQRLSAVAMPPGIIAASPLLARVVAVIELRREDRGLRIEPWSSRAIRTGGIHELICTDEPSHSDTRIVDRVAYLAFVEFTQGGIACVGDVLRHGNRAIGTLRGFDDTHMPNHMNIVFDVPRRVTGGEAGWHLGDTVSVGGADARPTAPGVACDA